MSHRFNGWMAARRLSQNQVARLLGTTRQLVQSWSSGRVRPGTVSALAIERLSQGEVPVESWPTAQESGRLAALDALGARLIEKGVDAALGGQ